MFLAALLLVTVPLGVHAPAGLAGHWEGHIDIPEHELGMTLDIAKNARGAWEGSITILLSSSVDVPLDDIVADGPTVRFTAALPQKTTFEATLSPDASRVSGMVSNMDGRVPFSVERKGEPGVKLPPPSSTLTKAFEGRWEGTLESGGRTRHVVLTLCGAADGTAVGMLVSVEKGLEIPVTTVTITGNELSLESRAVSGTFRGTLAAGERIAGEWIERDVRLPLTFRRAAVPKQ
jgi:hypothetical protein